MCSASQPSSRPSTLAILQRETFLAEQRIAAVAAADRDDRVVLREMANQAPLGIQVERAMNSAIEIGRFAKLLERRRAHPRHDSHVQHDVDAVSQLDADLRQRRPERAHHVRHHVHRAPAHRAVEPSAQLGVSGGRLGPVVGRPGVVFFRRADESQLLGARDVVGIRSMQVAAGPLLLVELDQYSRGDRLFGEPLLLRFGTVAPHDRVRLGQRGDFLDPIAQRAAAGGRFASVGIGRHFMRSVGPCET